MFLRCFFPYEYVDSVFSLDYEKLYRLGYRGLLLDIDNTLVLHGADSNPAVDELFRQIHRAGFKTLLLSNNSEDKPSPAGYLRALEMLQIPKEQAIVIGDQIFTDVYGANRCGVASILVRFLRRDGERKIGKRRWAEKLLLQLYRLDRASCHRLGCIIKEGDAPHA